VYEIAVTDLARQNLLRIDDDRLAECLRDARGDKRLAALESENVKEDEGEYGAGDETEREIAHEVSWGRLFLPLVGQISLDGGLSTIIKLLTSFHHPPYHISRSETRFRLGYPMWIGAEI
jgi:hypothetical protein